MRARNIKPGFFKNEYLAELEPLARLLFLGLAGLADREGRLHYRPKKIKADVLPYDDVNIENLLEQLANSIEKFIIIYEVDGCKYIQVNNFKKHNNPHPKEPQSTIPSYFQKSHGNSMTSNGNSMTSNGNSVEGNAESLILNPESLILNLESCILNPEIQKTDDAAENQKTDSAYEIISNHYFKLTGRLANSQDFVAITQVLDRPIGVPTSCKSRIDIIKRAMDKCCSKVKSDSQTIKTFKYFLGPIEDEFKTHETLNRKEVNYDGKPSDTVNGQVIDFSKGIRKAGS